MAYIFDPKELQTIVSRHLGAPLEIAFDGITADLASAYPGHVNTAPRSWIFNNAGGAMGQLSFLHGSIREYLFFFGTPIGTEGHSGRYPTSVWDFMITGEVWTYLEGTTERIVSKPGTEPLLLPKGAGKGYRAFEDSWMLEYARGPIPVMLPFGLWDAFFSTLDVPAAARTIWHYGRLAAREVLHGRTMPR